MSSPPGGLQFRAGGEAEDRAGGCQERDSGGVGFPAENTGTTRVGTERNPHREFRDKEKDEVRGRENVTDRVNPLYLVYLQQDEQNSNY